MKQIVIVWIFLVFAIAMVFLLQNNLQKSSKLNYASNSSYKKSDYARQSKQAQTYNAPAKPKYDDAEIQRKLRFKAGVTE